MEQGKIWVASNEGTYLIKMMGDVRLTLCLSFDRFINDMLDADDFESIVVDLSGAESVDSTTLGLMAKIALRAHERRDVRPAIISGSASIHRLLETMGLLELFDVVDEAPPEMAKDSCLNAGELVERDIRRKVLEAHRILMELNEENHETFRDLVKTLEDEG